MLLMSVMLQIWMKLMVLMLLMMSDTDDDKAWRRRDLLLAGQPASQPAGWLAALPALGLPHGPLSGPDRASYGVWRDVIWIKLKLSARSTRLDGSQHPDIVSNGRLWRNNAEHMKKMTKKILKMVENKVVELFFPVISGVKWRSQQLSKPVSWAKYFLC